MTDFSDSTFDRRAFITKAAAGAAAVSAAGILAACGAQSVGTTTTSAGGVALPGGTPSRGGRFTAGLISGGSAETLVPTLAGSYPDFARAFQLYNCLFYTGVKINPPEPGLALSAEANPDATVWTIHLRDGVIWHDGKPFTADDVVWTFRRMWGDPESFAYGYLAGLVNFSGVRKRGRLTVEVPLTMPLGALPAFLCNQNFYVTQYGATPASIARNPIGTGPFKFKSFTPGAQSVFTANRDYWESGKPYVDEVVIDSSFTDQTSLVNAFLAGDINLLPSIPPLAAKSQMSNQQVLVSALPAITLGFAMRVTTGPFVDKRVREAFKLLVDHKAILETVGAGYGSVAYDVQGPGCEYYLEDFTMERDVEKAKSLLKAAGVDGQTFKLVNAPVYPGLVESSIVLAQQAKEAGVNLQVDTIAASEFYTKAGGAGVRQFAVVNNLPPFSSLAQLFKAYYGPDAQFHDTGWGSEPGGPQAQSQKRINEAIVAVEPARAEALWREVQLDQAHEGPYVWWGNLPFIDGAASNVRGLRASSGANYYNWRLLDGWLA